MAAPLSRLIAPQAYPFSGALAVGSGLALTVGWPATAAGLGLLAAANLAFFRNPRRSLPAGESLVVSPADGKVVEVAAMADPGGFVGASWRIAIFLSVLDVHVNRAPISAKVRAVHRSGTRFLAAFRPQASSENVQTRLELEAAGGARLALVQITGLIARRIVCYAQPGDALERGAPYGLICYGSRVELYLPAASRPRVATGDRAWGGETVLAELAP